MTGLEPAQLVVPNHAGHQLPNMLISEQFQTIIAQGLVGKAGVEPTIISYEEIFIHLFVCCISRTLKVFKSIQP